MGSIIKTKNSKCLVILTVISLFVKSQFPVKLSIFTGLPQLPQIVPNDTPIYVAIDFSEEEANTKVWQDIRFGFHTCIH